MANDPYWNSVVLAMHMDDTGLTDLKGHAITLNGNAARSATKSVFGGYSAYFDGTGDYLGVTYASDLNFAGAEFTIEALCVLNKTTGASVLLDFRGSGLWSVSWNVYLDAAARSARIYDGPLNSVVISTAANSLPGVGEWFKLVIQRSGTTTTLRVVRIDGTNYSASAVYNPPTTSSTGLRIGISQAASDGLIGYVDELLITKGVVRFSGDIPWPTEAFPNKMVQIAGTVRDTSGNYVTRTVHVHRQSDGALAGVAASDGTTGAYSISALDTSLHYATCFPSATSDEALVHHSITPV